MRWVLVLLLALHGLLHLLGVAKAFGWAELPQLVRPIGRPLGLVWLAAALGMLATAALLALGHRAWWILALVSVVLSQAAIVTSWSDARFGTVVNVVLVAAALYGLASEGPWSFRRAYRRELTEALAKAPPGTGELVREVELAHLPAPLRRYVIASGAVGRPCPRHFRVLWEGRIRGGPDEPWMPFRAEQDNVVEPPVRLFRMDARRGGVPVDVYHAYREGRATMRVRVLSAFPVEDARGPEMDRAETVTVFNDLCLFAPWALAGLPVAWEEVDERTVRGRLTVAGIPVSAELRFDAEGRLVDFVSDDRLMSSGGRLTPLRWSTPVGDYRSFGPLRVATTGQGVWHAPEGPWVYIDGRVRGVEIDPEGPGSAGSRSRPPGRFS